MTSPASHTSKSLKHIPALDGLRGIAILWVVLHHGGWLCRDGTAWGGVVYSNIVSVGWVGVDLFFVLSGFLIGSILIKSHGRPGWIRIFIVRRALRVLPLYFVVVLVCFNVLPEVEWSGFDGLRKLAPDQWWYWLHLANVRKIAGDFDSSLAPVGWFSTYWSLSIEEHFYLIWPLAVLAAGPKQLWKVSVMGIVAIAILRTGLAFARLPDSVIYNNTFTRLDGLMLGTLLAWCNEFHPNRLRRGKWLPATGLTIALLAFFVPITMGYRGGGRQTLYGLIALYPASVLASGVAVWYLITRPAENRVVAACSAGWLRGYGRYSYAIYVFNKPIILGFSTVMMPTFGRLPTLPAMMIFLAVCLTCWIAGWLSWRLIEQPCLSLKRHVPSPTTGLIKGVREDQGRQTNDGS